MEKYDDLYYNRFTTKKYVTKELIKWKAKLLVEKTGCKPTHAHEMVAKSYGYNTYNHFLQGNKNVQK